MLTSEPLTHDLLTCSGITSGDTTSCLLRSVKQDVEFRLLRIESGTLGVGDEIHSSEFQIINLEIHCYFYQFCLDR